MFSKQVKIVDYGYIDIIPENTIIDFHNSITHNFLGIEMSNKRRKINCNSDTLFENFLESTFIDKRNNRKITLELVKEKWKQDIAVITFDQYFNQAKNLCLLFKVTFKKNKK